MRSRLARGSVPIAILSTALVLAACGGGGGSTTSTASGISKAEFLAKANVICAKSSQVIQAAEQQFRTQITKPSAAQLRQFAALLAPMIEAQISGIKALGAPAGDSARIDAITSAAQSGVDRVRRDPAALLNGDPFAKANHLARAYGLTACAGG